MCKSHQLAVNIIDGDGGGVCVCVCVCEGHEMRWANLSKAVSTLYEVFRAMQKLMAFYLPSRCMMPN